MASVIESIVGGAYSFWQNVTPKYMVIECVMMKMNFWTHFLPISFCLGYIVFVLFMPAFQAKHKLITSWKYGPKVLKVVMAVWNLGLSLYSLSLFLFCFTESLHWLLEYGGNPWNLLCDKDGYIFTDKGPLIFWGWTFAMSKYFELADTFFLVIRQKPLTLLHTWHHVSVLLATWYGCGTRLSLGFPAMTMNSFIHTIMYFYYFLTVFGIKSPWAIYLTYAQTVQMVLGLIFTLMWFGGRYAGYGCHCSDKYVNVMAILFLTIYGSYFVLFSKFLIARYYRKKAIQSKKDDDENANALEDISEDPRADDMKTPGRPQRD